MWETIQEKISVNYIKSEILKTTYGNRDTFTAHLDPRTLLAWYLFFAIVPWFFYNRTILIGICLLVGSVALYSRVSGLILFMLAFGVIGDAVGWALTSLFFGGDLSVFWSLTTLILKLIAISLASIAIFSSLEPDRFSDGLLALGMPDQFAFGVSYAYRMIPVLLEEYNNIINAYRLRGREPETNGFLYYRKIFYFLSLIVRAFYPMILNTAKRTRTTVEGLEIKGFTYSLSHPEVKKLRLQYLKFGASDGLFILSSACIFVLIVVIGNRFPL